MTRYDGPFEILRRLSLVTYQLRMPVSYGIHPIINIAHLEAYMMSPSKFGQHTMTRLAQESFEEKPEFEVTEILAEQLSRTRTGRHTKEFKVIFVGFGPEYDEWITKKNLKNALLIIVTWDKAQEDRKRSRPSTKQWKELE